MQPDEPTTDAGVALGTADLARLRPGVDVAALERFLAAVPELTRRVIVLSFMRDASIEEIRDATGFPAPASAPKEDFFITIAPAADPALQRLWRSIEPAAWERRGPPPPARDAG